jgi:hypothetical protein
MKKARKNLRITALKVDVLEYAFTEWLVRRGIYSAFKSNFKPLFLPDGSFRDRLHAYVKRSICHSSYCPEGLIFSAFLFVLTPEGPEFWREQSAAWKRFCSEFSIKF